MSVATCVSSHQSRILTLRSNRVPSKPFDQKSDNVYMHETLCEGVNSYSQVQVERLLPHHTCWSCLCR